MFLWRADLKWGCLTWFLMGLIYVGGGFEIFASLCRSILIHVSNYNECHKSCIAPSSITHTPECYIYTCTYTYVESLTVFSLYLAIFSLYYFLYAIFSIYAFNLIRIDRILPIIAFKCLLPALPFQLLYRSHPVFLGWRCDLGLCPVVVNGIAE